MLRTTVLLWVLALGMSTVGFMALVVVQGVAGRVRRRARVAPVAAPATVPIPAARVETARQVAEPLAG